MVHATVAASSQKGGPSPEHPMKTAHEVRVTAQSCSRIIGRRDLVSALMPNPPSGLPARAVQPRPGGSPFQLAQNPFSPLVLFVWSHHPEWMVRSLHVSQKHRPDMPNFTVVWYVTIRAEKLRNIDW